MCGFSLDHELFFDRTAAVQYEGDCQSTSPLRIHLLRNGPLFSGDFDIHGILGVPAALEQADNCGKEETLQASRRLENPCSRRLP